MGLIGLGIALAAIAVCATYLEVNGHESKGLWFVVTVGVLLGDWTPKKKESGNE